VRAGTLKEFYTAGPDRAKLLELSPWLGDEGRMGPEEC